jgi:hypothetical protein
MHGMRERIASREAARAMFFYNCFFQIPPGGVEAAVCVCVYYAYAYTHTHTQRLQRFFEGHLEDWNDLRVIKLQSTLRHKAPGDAQFS